jgi:TetR/AcrR family transcriptional regulator
MTTAEPRNRNAPVGLPEADILRRGLEIFAELGYEATSVRVLAKRLAVSHNFINDRYGSKADFWRAVVQAAMREREAALVRLNRRDDSMPDDARLTALVLDLYRNAAEMPEINRVFAHEAGHDTERLAYLYAEFIEPFFAGLRLILDRLMAAGRMPAVPQELVYFAITGPALALTHDPLAHRLGRPERPTPQERRDRADALARLVLEGLLPSGAPARAAK